MQKRAKLLLSRYQVTPSRAIKAIDACVAGLVNHGCYPTFPTPGIVLQNSPLFFQHLQEVGAEIAVHGYQHVDLKAYPVNEGCKQLAKAAESLRIMESMSMDFVVLILASLKNCWLCFLKDCLDTAAIKQFNGTF